MLRSALLSLLAFALAIGGGALSVRFALDQGETVEIAGWRMAPQDASSGSNPYARARLARDGVLPLGPAEGLTFSTGLDAGGAPLRRDCSYDLAGLLPAGRVWTLHAAGAGRLPDAGPSLNSFAVVYDADGSVRVAVSPSPAPGNWLATAGAGRLELVLTVYDTPIAADDTIALPAVALKGCDG